MSFEVAIDEKRQESRHAGVSREPGVREHVRELARISAAEGAGVQTDLVGASAVLRVAHVVSLGSVRGIDVRNLGPAGAGRTIVIDLDDNEVFENTAMNGQGIRFVNVCALLAPCAPGAPPPSVLTGLR